MVALVEASLLVWCVIRHDSRLIAEAEGLNLRNLATKVTSIVHRNASSVAIVNSAVNSTTAFKKEHGMSFFASHMVGIAEGMVMYDFSTGNSPQANQR